MNIKKPFSKVIGVGAIAALALSACSEASGDAADSIEEMDPITLTIPEQHAEGDPWSQDLIAFADSVEERTDGKITVDFYFSEALVPTDEVAQAISDGTADMGKIYPTHNPNVNPVGSYFMELGALATSSYPHGIMQSTGVSTEAYLTMDELQLEQDNLNVDVKWSIAVSQGYDMLCNTEVTSAADLEGLRVRTSGEPWVSEVEALGMAAVSMQAGEVYEALQRGTLDCVTMSPSPFMAWDYWDVAEYYIPLSLTPYNSAPFYVNRDTWASLPQDAQQLLDEEIHKLGLAGAKTFGNAYNTWMSEADDKGIITVETADMDEILAEHQAEHREEMLDRAPAGVEDPAAFVAEVEQLHEDWLDLTVEGLDQPLIDTSNTSVVEEAYLSYDPEMWSFFDETMQERLGN